MNIRIAYSSDLPEVFRIENACYQHPWPEILFRGHIGEDGFMVGEIDGVICGYIVIGIKIPTLFQRLEKRTKALAGQPVNLEEQVGHLMNVAVDPAFRGRGIAKALINQGINYLKSIDASSIELEVRTTNESAIRLYEQFGFKTLRIIQNYYHDGEDALFMRKEL